MDKNPFKVIYKYNNTFNNVSYINLIFLNEKYLKIMPLLKKIKNLSLDKCLIDITLNEFQNLVKHFSEQWYKYFFNKNHLLLYTKKISKDQNILRLIKINKKWMVDNIINYEKNFKNIYSFEKELTYDMKYKEYLNNLNYSHKGGEELNEPEILEYDLENQDGDENINQISFDDFDVQTEDLLETTAENKKVSDDIRKSPLGYKYIISFNNKSKEFFSLEESYNKQYIFGTEILMDDTINEVLEKICYCVNIEHPSNFRLTPTRLYIWSEYNLANKKKSEICLTHNWIYNTSPLEIDIVPLNNKDTYMNISIGSRMKKIYDILTSFNNISKIKCIDNRNKILNSFSNYIENDEIFCVDVYSQLWSTLKKNDPESVDILHTFFIKLYFPLCFKYFKNHVVPAIVYNDKNEGVLNKNYMEAVIPKIELNKKISGILDSIEHNKKIEKEVFITQTIFYCNLLNKKNVFFNLKEIFNFFKLDNTFMFIKYHNGGTGVIKIYKDLEKFVDKDKYKLWVSNSSPGLIIKYYLKNIDRFVTLFLTRTGKLEIKLQWREVDRIINNSLEDYKDIILETVSKLVKECILDIDPIEKDNIKLKFINSIQQFTLKNNIDHNKLSYFIRYFHSIFSLVVNSLNVNGNLVDNIKNTDKWGTYLRFKKVDDYENKDIIMKRIIYYLKNYNTEDNLVQIISNEFNISTKDSEIIINKTKKRFRKLVLKNVSKEKTKVLKENISANKIKRGIQIAIQGKKIDSYKIRIEGAKSLYTIKNISMYLNKILYIYSEIYIEKNKNFQFIENELKNLLYISERKGYILDIYNYEESSNIKTLKNMKKNHDIIKNIKNSRYSRECQNSGKKIRRPTQITSENDLSQYGYKFNKSTNRYEKKNKNNEILYALKYNDDLFYICDEKVNNERKYIGILNKTNNNLPCCFLKNQLLSKNKDIQIPLQNALDNEINNNNIKKITAFEESNLKYIRKLSNKIQPSRFFYLSGNLSSFFNKKLLDDEESFFLLYGVNDIDFYFLDTLNLYLQEPNICSSIIKKLRDSFKDEIFLSLDGGNVYNVFKSKENFITNINNKINHKYVIDLVSGLFLVNIIILEKMNNVEDDYKILPVSRFNQEYRNIFFYTEESGDEDKVFYPIVLYDSKKKNLRLFYYVNNKVLYDIMKVINLNHNINYDFYKENKAEITGQILNDNNSVRFYINDKKELFPVLKEPPLYFLPIIKKFAAQNLKLTLQYIDKYPFFEIKSFVVQNNYITGICVYIKNMFTNITSFIPIEKERIRKKNIYFPLEKEDLFRNGDGGVNNFKYTMNSKSLEFELYELFRFHFSQFIKEKNLKDTNFKSLEDVRKLTKLFCHDTNMNFNNWCNKNKSSIINMDLNNRRELCNADNILCFKKKMLMFKDVYDSFNKRIYKEINDNFTKKKELFQIDELFVSKVIQIDRYIIQENEILEIYNTKLSRDDFVEEVQEGKNKTDFFLLFSPNIYEQKVRNDNHSIVRALVTSLYFSENYPKDKNLKISNLGYYSDLQEKITLHYISEIVRFGKEYLMTGLIKIPSSIYSQKIDKNTITNFYSGYDIHKMHNLIVYIFSLLLKRSVFVKVNNSNYSISHKSIYYFKNSKDFYQNIDGVTIKILTDDKLKIKEISSVFKI